MTSSIIFKTNLYEEHLEEASFLYETRVDWLNDDEVGWLEVEEVDVRLESHIDAIIVGGEFALRYCIENIENADFATIYVITRVLRRHRTINQLEKIIDLVDPSDQDLVYAVSAGLRNEGLASLNDSLRFTKSTGITGLCLRLDLYGTNRAAVIKEILVLLGEGSSDECKFALSALGRYAQEFKGLDISNIRKLITREEVLLANQAAIVLLKSGDKSLLHERSDMVGVIPIAFALGGGLNESRSINSIVKEGHRSPNAVIAMGLSGNLESVYLLLELLNDPSSSGLAAQSLQLITGANLYEDVHVEHEVDPQELFEFELEIYEKGELPKNIDGRNYGDEVHRLVRNPTIWREWLQINKSNFSTGIRYRNGKPFSPSELVTNLVESSTPLVFRKCCIDELMIRYGLDITFSACDSTSVQKAVINRVHRWCKERESGWGTGTWVY